MSAASQVPRVGVVFRPQLPPERLREYVVSAEAAGLDDVWLWGLSGWVPGRRRAVSALSEAQAGRRQS
jgi:hypothetical protein